MGGVGHWEGEVGVSCPVSDRGTRRRAGVVSGWVSRGQNESMKGWDTRNRWGRVLKYGRVGTKVDSCLGGVVDSRGGKYMQGSYLDLLVLGWGGVEHAL
eukprot:757032-Hanusia_phi.AAC.4